MSASTRRFYLERVHDITGVSGKGHVADGVQFSDKTVVVRWRGKTKTTTVHENIESVEAVHLHGGATLLKWIDPICFQCGAVLFDDERFSRHCFGCGAGQGKDLFYETRPNPSLGTWGPALVIQDPSPTTPVAPGG